MPKSLVDVYEKIRFSLSEIPEELGIDFEFSAADKINIITFIKQCKDLTNFYNQLMEVDQINSRIISVCYYHFSKELLSICHNKLDFIVLLKNASSEQQSIILLNNQHLQKLQNWLANEEDLKEIIRSANFDQTNVKNIYAIYFRNETENCLTFSNFIEIFSSIKKAINPINVDLSFLLDPKKKEQLIEKVALMIDDYDDLLLLLQASPDYRDNLVSELIIKAEKKIISAHPPRKEVFKGCLAELIIHYNDLLLTELSQLRKDIIKKICSRFYTHFFDHERIYYLERLLVDFEDFRLFICYSELHYDENFQVKIYKKISNKFENLEYKESDFDDLTILIDQSLYYLSWNETLSHSLAKIELMRFDLYLLGKAEFPQFYHRIKNYHHFTKKLLTLLVRNYNSLDQFSLLIKVAPLNLQELLANHGLHDICPVRRSIAKFQCIQELFSDDNYKIETFKLWAVRYFFADIKPLIRCSEDYRYFIQSIANASVQAAHIQEHFAFLCSFKDPNLASILLEQLYEVAKITLWRNLLTNQFNTIKNYDDYVSLKNKYKGNIYQKIALIHFIWDERGYLLKNKCSSIFVKYNSHKIKHSEDFIKYYTSISIVKRKKYSKNLDLKTLITSANMLGQFLQVVPDYPSEIASDIDRLREQFKYHYLLANWQQQFASYLEKNNLATTEKINWPVVPLIYNEKRLLFFFSALQENTSVDTIKIWTQSIIEQLLFMQAGGIPAFVDKLIVAVKKYHKPTVSYFVNATINYLQTVRKLPSLDLSMLKEFLIDYQIDKQPELAECKEEIFELISQANRAIPRNLDEIAVDDPSQTLGAVFNSNYFCFPVISKKRQIECKPTPIAEETNPISGSKTYQPEFFQTIKPNEESIVPGCIFA